jgi:hypothetical protein
VSAPLKVDPARLNIWQYFGQACVVCERVFGSDESVPAVGAVRLECGTRPIRTCASCEPAGLCLVASWQTTSIASATDRTPPDGAA